MKTALSCMSLFTAVAGLWLAVMENILKHAGYAGRSAIAACIVIQGLATVLWLARDGRTSFRILILAGAVGVALLGASAIKRILDAPHFEGFVFLIGSALIVQGILALAVVLVARPGKTIYGLRSCMSNYKSGRNGRGRGKVLVLVVAMLAVAYAADANFSGKWLGSSPDLGATYAVLKQEGTTLTGSASSR